MIPTMFSATVSVMDGAKFLVPKVADPFMKKRSQFSPKSSLSMIVRPRIVPRLGAPGRSTVSKSRSPLA